MATLPPKAERLARIYDRQVHRVHVLDFDVPREEMEQVITDKLRMEHTSADGQVVFTSHAWRQLFGIRGLLRRQMTWRQFISVLGLHTVEEMESDGFRAYWMESLKEIASKADLQVRHLRRLALGRKQGARMSGGHFIARLGVHFGLITEQSLQTLTMEVHELTMIDIDELVRLRICDGLGDVMAWVAMGLERQ
ncbi:hypothetical protein Tco_0168797 [Tanacetum coccineum]